MLIINSNKQGQNLAPVSKRLPVPNRTLFTANKPLRVHPQPNVYSLANTATVGVSPDEQYSIHGFTSPLKTLAP